MTVSTFPINLYAVWKIHVVSSGPGELKEELLHLYPQAARRAVVQRKGISARPKLGTGFRKCWVFPFMVSAALLQKKSSLCWYKTPVGFTAQRPPHRRDVTWYLLYHTHTYPVYLLLGGEGWFLGDLLNRNLARRHG